jgi:2-dehydro-3-deoxy-D-arabinonate dehydratase
MNIIRYADADGNPVMAAVTGEGKVHPLPLSDYREVVRRAEAENVSTLAFVEALAASIEPLPSPVEEPRLLVPIDAPEVWAAGVTYERSRVARNYEATGGRMDATTFYDKVYEAERPEIFFKSTAARTVGPNQAVYLRSDSVWQIPEPELGLVLTSEGRIVGFTIGNDMSCRDIEGENPLYLPQAKMWKHSCSLGPAIRIAEAVADPYRLQITCRIVRNGNTIFEGTASTGQLKRKLKELVSFLKRDNELFDGTVLLTGTCIVPPDDFSLAPGDRVDISIEGIGTLSNPVSRQDGGI